MTKLKMLTSMIVCIALIFALSACGGGGTNSLSTKSTATQGVSFSFSKNGLVSAKRINKTVYAEVPTTIDPTARYASITVTDEAGISKEYRTDIYSLNGSYVTATVALPNGSYNITQFLVLDSNNNILYLVPTQSAAADIKALVSTVLPLNFNVATDQTNKVTLQVLAPDASTAAEFGYPSVAFSIVSYTRLMSCIQIMDSATQTWKLASGNLTVNGVDYSQPDKTATLRVKQADSYTLVFSKTGYATKTIVLSAAEVAAYATTPLIVQLSPQSYTVTFNSNGGSSVASQTVGYGGFAVRPADPVKAGYTFLYWYSSDDPANGFGFGTTPITADKTLYAKWAAPTGKVISWTGVDRILIDGVLVQSPYIVPAGRTTMTIRISGGAGGASGEGVAGSNGELRTFTGVPISNSTYTVTMGQAGANGEVITNNAGGGGGGGGASTIKIGNLYIAGAAGGNGSDGGGGVDYVSSPGGAGGSGDGPGSDGGASNTYSDQGPGLGGLGGQVNTGGLAVGGTVTGSGNGYLEIITTN